MRSSDMRRLILCEWIFWSWQASRCVEYYLRPPRRRSAGQGSGQEAEGRDRSPYVRSGGAGGDWIPRDCSRDRSCDAKKRDRQCYGGDITRKRKLWAKQREGKKRMKSIGSVDILKKAFMAVLETGPTQSRPNFQFLFKKFGQPVSIG